MRRHWRFAAGSIICCAQAARPDQGTAAQRLEFICPSRITMASLSETGAQQTRVAILGASGYSGADLVRLLALHPATRIVALTGERQAGKAMADVFPHLAGLDLPRLTKIDEVDWSGVDFTFC